MNWIKKYIRLNKGLRAQIDDLTNENVEFLNKMREINEEKDMIKKLARTQAQENLELLGKACLLDGQLKTVSDELKLFKEGVSSQPGEIKAISVVRVTSGDGNGTKATYSPLILTLNKEGTQILERRMLPDTEWDYTMNQAKIEFVNLFDPTR